MAPASDYALNPHRKFDMNDNNKPPFKASNLGNFRPPGPHVARLRFDALSGGQSMFMNQFLLRYIVHRTNAKHGLSKSREYKTWAGMKFRCFNSKHKSYHNYGGRGITVCERWLGINGFRNFLSDMGPRPPRMSIERKDNNGNYCPENCKWATKREQQNNLRRNVVLEYEGRRMSISDWAREKGVRPSLLYLRHSKGWPVSEILTTPARYKAPRLSDDFFLEVKEFYDIGLSLPQLKRRFGIPIPTLYSGLLRLNTVFRPSFRRHR